MTNQSMGVGKGGVNVCRLQPWIATKNRVRGVTGGEHPTYMLDR